LAELGVAGPVRAKAGNEFIAVTKREGEWAHLKPAILGAIMEHFLSGDALLRAGADGSIAAEGGDEFFEEKDAGTVATIKELIETRVRPAVASDGGDITFRGFREGVVYLNMRGACAGCPSSTITLRNGIENSVISLICGERLIVEETVMSMMPWRIATSSRVWSPPTSWDPG